MVKVYTHIAIDGPAASGKTTVGRMVARRLNYLYLDTGAMYRALAFLALQSQTDLDNERALLHLCDHHHIRVKLDLDAPIGYRIFAGDTDLTTQLTSSAVTAVVSTVAAHSLVRARLVEEQRAIAAEGPVVMAGRDIGTVVLPDARYKIYLTASVQERVERRRAELQAAGVDIEPHELREEIEERDRLDETRLTSPLRPASDATVIDSTGKTAAQVCDQIVGLVTAEARS
ncbi:MAG: (d)CMP kinase [Candidatus Eremiobacteraeota bacterium]|nr:(d)CMP kinase [Candidatus Eremiobacteraeota bacterium]